MRQSPDNSRRQYESVGIRDFRESQVRRDYRHSPPSKYISKYMNEIENTPSHAVPRYSTEIEGSGKYNPERTSYGTSLRSSFYKEGSAGYGASVLGNISNSKVGPSNSIETLSRELDDRIAKIKQKYYESGESMSASTAGNWRNTGDVDRSLHERKLNNYVGEARSRHQRDPARQALYAPYNATRSISYHYDYQ